MMHMLGFLIQCADEPQVSVDVIRHEVHFVDELVQVSRRCRHGFEGQWLSVKYKILIILI